MIACYLMLFIIIVQSVIIYYYLNDIKKDYTYRFDRINKKLEDIINKNADIKSYVNYIFNKTESIDNVINHHIKDSINGIMFNTHNISEEIKHIAKCNKNNEAKFSFVLKILRLLSSKNNKKNTKLKTAEINENK